MKRRTILQLLGPLALLLALTLPGTAGYAEGEKLFKAQCSSCHSGYVPADRIKENFFEKENKLLNLKAPTVNMLAWAITEGPRKIGDPSDAEMRQAEIEEYLREVLEHPEQIESICDANVKRYYRGKQPVIQLSDEELADLAAYLLEYKAHRQAKEPPVKRHLGKDFDANRLLAEAKKSGKILIIEASSPHCHYCTKMDREVIQSPMIRRMLQKGFILAEVNVEESRLPLGLDKIYRKITPSFFFLAPDGRLLGHFPGSWTRNDFAKMLEEYAPKNK
jgi:mono/diheme cytochrome c family protein